MYKGLYKHYATVITVLLHIPFPVGAYYRCDWVTTNDSDGSSTVDPVKEGLEVKTRQCYYKDSDIMSAFVTNCTRQTHFIRTCTDMGTWDCGAFVAMCKTLIKVEQPKRNNDVISVVPASDQTLQTQRRCDPDRTHFSLQEMSLAVLVSFISGSVILFTIVYIVWKCRDVTWLTSQTRTEERHREQRKAALHAITQIARVLNAQPSDTDTVFYMNPSYSKSVASDIIDVISENDHIYEEVMLRRMSKAAPLSPGAAKRRTTLRKSNSLNSIMEIAEILEKDHNNRESGGIKVDVKEAKGEDEDKTDNDIEAPSTSDSGYLDDIDNK